jgi:twitching motility two-component system response regulator PilH
MLKELLENNGYRAVTAEDGEDALKKVAQHHPCLILLDIILPKKNGFQVCRQIKTSPDTHDIKIVMVSSKSEEADRFWGMKQGADAYIAKPIVEQDLLNTVAKLLKKS